MTRTRTGLALLGLLSLADLTAPAMSDGSGPPIGVALASSVLGLASLVLIWYAARGAVRAVTPLLGLRVLSALTAVPAFFVDDVPTVGRVLAAVFIALTVVGVALVAPARAEARRPELAR